MASTFLLGCQKTNIVYSGHLQANEIFGQSVVYNDLVSPITSSKLGTHSPQFDEAEYTYYFDDATTTINEDYILVGLQIPHNYKQGSNISCHLHAYQTQANNGNFTIRLNYTWYNINEVNGQKQSITKNFTLNTPTRNNTILDFGEINGINKTISSTFKAEIRRIAGDNSTNNLYIDFFDCHYQQDTLGSFGWFTK